MTVHIPIHVGTFFDFLVALLGFWGLLYFLLFAVGIPIGLAYMNVRDWLRARARKALRSLRSRPVEGPRDWSQCGGWVENGRPLDEEGNPKPSTCRRKEGHPWGTSNHN